MKLLVIGSGGREHALVWKLAQSLHVTQIWCAPGNAGIAAQADCVNIKAGDVIPIDVPELVTLCAEDVPLFRAKFGVSQGSRALKIQGKIKQH